MLPFRPIHGYTGCHVVLTVKGDVDYVVVITCGIAVGISIIGCFDIIVRTIS